MFCEFFSHTQIDCPPIIFLGFGNAKCHTVYIVKTKTFHLSLSIFPLFFGYKNSDKELFCFKLFDRFKEKKRSFYQFFGQIWKKNYRKVSAPACSRFPRIYINSRRLKQVTADCLGFHLMAERDFVGFYPWNYQICFPLGCPDVRNSVDVCNFPLYIMCETSECCKTNASEDVKKTYQ